MYCQYFWFDCFVRESESYKFSKFLKSDSFNLIYNDIYDVGNNGFDVKSDYNINLYNFMIKLFTP